MTTKVYDNYSAFLARADKKENGVSKEFAVDHAEIEKQNATNEACWNCSDCSDCSDCSGCSDCSRCSGCSGLKSARPVVAQDAGSSWFDVPKIPNIHSTIFAAASKPDALNMGDWHTCETTHCRAGWAVFLAGEKGAKLEKASSTLFAAMQIYKASSLIKVSPVRFFEKNEVALADLKRCAEEEAAGVS